MLINDWIHLVIPVCSQLEFLVCGKVIPVNILVTIPFVCPHYNIIIDCWTILVIPVCGDLKLSSTDQCIDIQVPVPVIFPHDNILVDGWVHLVSCICSDLDDLRTFTETTQKDQYQYGYTHTFSHRCPPE